MDVAEEVGGKLIVASGDAAAVLEAAEHALDGVAALVEAAAEAAFPEPIGLGRDVRNGILTLDQAPDAVAVVGAVGMNDAARRQARQQLLGRLAVSGLARCQQEGERSALAVGDRVDLGVAATPADADRLMVSPPSPPAAER